MYGRLKFVAEKIFMKSELYWDLKCVIELLAYVDIALKKID